MGIGGSVQGVLVSLMVCINPRMSLRNSLLEIVGALVGDALVDRGEGITEGGIGLLYSLLVVVS